MATTGSRSDALRPASEQKAPPSRNPAAQRRAMEAALATAVMAVRSREGRRGGWPPPGYV